MYCPNCGQERVSYETSFCSRCGFLLTGAAELLQTGGVIPSISRQGPVPPSPRKRGLKLGLFIFLLTFLIVPLMAIISKGLNLTPVLVALAAILLTMGGLLRMVYALMFESPGPDPVIAKDPFLAAAQNHFDRSPHGQALPPGNPVPATVYTVPMAGSWRDTNDLQPASVTEGTTKLLEKDELG